MYMHIKYIGTCGSFTKKHWCKDKNPQQTQPTTPSLKFEPEPHWPVTGECKWTSCPPIVEGTQLCTSRMLMAHVLKKRWKCKRVHTLLSNKNFFQPHIPVVGYWGSTEEVLTHETWFHDHGTVCTLNTPLWNHLQNRFILVKTELKIAGNQMPAHFKSRVLFKFTSCEHGFAW